MATSTWHYGAAEQAMRDAVAQGTATPTAGLLVQLAIAHALLANTGMGSAAGGDMTSYTHKMKGTQT